MEGSESFAEYFLEWGHDGISRGSEEGGRKEGWDEQRCRLAGGIRVHQLRRRGLLLWGD